MDIEDHLPQEPEEITFEARVREAIEFGDMEQAGYILTQEMQSFFTDYAGIESLFGLLRIANHVNVMNVEGNNCIFDVRKKLVCIPYTVALQITSMHDVACLLLVERNRLIVGRSVHTYIPQGMDLSQISHKSIYDLALSCWSIALSRCFCASILPERLYAPYPDMFHNLMHGLVPDQLAKAIEKDYPNIAEAYLNLYNMGGQEQYHSNLNRVASGATGTLPFISVLESFWEDLRKEAPTNEQIEQIMDSLLARNENDGEEERPVKNQQAQEQAEKDANGKKGKFGGYGYGRGGSLEAVPTVDLDLESDLDQHLSQFMRVSVQGSSGYYDRFHGLSSQSPTTARIRAGFEGLQHTVMLESNSNEDDGVFGQIMPPDHPTTRDLSMYMQGYMPMLWETKMSSASPARADIRYDAYFDISGSMYRWFPVVRALLRNLGVYIRPKQVYGFSTTVTDIDMDASFLLTAGGTLIKSAIDHAKSRGVKHVLLITDLGCGTMCDTEGIEHIIIVATDCNKNTKIEDTVFAQHHAMTKIDLYPVQYSDLVRSVPDMASFNDADI